MGTSDLVKDLNAQHTPLRLPAITALVLCLLAARAYGLAILDGVYLDLDDEAAFEAACTQGLELGRNGTTLIQDRKSVVLAKRVSVRVYHGGRRTIDHSTQNPPTHEDPSILTQ